MIKWLMTLLKGKTIPPAVVAEEEVIDTDSIYYRLRMAMGRISTNPIDLTVNPGALGRIESYCETLEDLLNSLMEINYVLKQNQYIERNLLHTREVKTVRLDRFLFVRGNYYIKDAPELLQKVLEQIDVYYEQMKDADKAIYGVVEHNHRQLYSYTNTIVHLLDSIFDHFSQ